MVMTGTQEIVDKFIANSDKPIVLKFWAEWCGPCRALKPIFEDIAKVVDADLLEINADDSLDLVQKYNIRGIPTMLFIKNGTIQKTLVGVQPKETIINIINELK